MILQDRSVLVIIDMQKVSLGDGLYPVYNVDNLVNKIKKVIDELKFESQVKITKLGNGKSQIQFPTLSQP